jgi:hypothetical protein
MQLTIAQAYELVSSHGVFARECCDKCGRLLEAVRFTRQGEAGEWCSRECRGDGARVVIRRGGRPRKYRNVEERRAAKTGSRGIIARSPCGKTLPQLVRNKPLTGVKMTSLDYSLG